MGSWRAIFDRETKLVTITSSGAGDALYLWKSGGEPTHSELRKLLESHSASARPDPTKWGLLSE